MGYMCPLLPSLPGLQAVAAMDILGMDAQQSGVWVLSDPPTTGVELN